MYLLHPIRPPGHTWIEKHISPDAPRLGTAVAPPRAWNGGASWHRRRGDEPANAANRVASGP